MASRVLILSIAVIALAHQAWGYGSGAPAGACSTFTPGHKEKFSNGTVIGPIAPQNANTSPYKVEVTEGNPYTAGKTVKVKLSGSEKFRGFFLAATKANDNKLIGEFTAIPNLTQKKNCTEGGNYVTHTDTSEKNDLVFTWQVPADTKDKIVFAATFAANHSTFWVKQKSAEISVVSSTTTCIFSAATIVLSLLFTTFLQL